MRMRFRTDGWHYADLKTYGWTRERFETEFKYPPEYIDEFEKAPKAEPGDVWRIRWHKNGGDGPIAGYAICCIGCGHVHNWTTAGNCSQKFETSYKNDKGEDVKYWTCPHSGTGSCWNWSGSAEENNLSATPSLQVTADDCKWHGYITNGDIHV